MRKRPINGRWTRSVVGHQHHLSEVQLLNHGVDVPHLICCGVGVPGGFLRGAPPKKIKRHDPAPWREPGKETVVEMQSVWKAMHQHDGGVLPWILTRREVRGTTLYDMFSVGYGVLLEHRFLLISCIYTYYDKKTLD